MRYLIIASVLVAIAGPAQASDSLFAKLVEATTSSNAQALASVLSTETLSTSDTTVGAGYRFNSGPMRHGVTATEIADKLIGCEVKQWQDVGSDPGRAYVLWECPAKQVASNDCYFYAYRAAMLDPRYHPANLFVHQTLIRDHVRCGRVIPHPPKLSAD